MSGFNTLRADRKGSFIWSRLGDFGAKTWIRLFCALLVAAAMPSVSFSAPIAIVETATSIASGGGGVPNPGFYGTRFQAPFTGTTAVATVGISRTYGFTPTPEMFAAIIQLSGSTDFPDTSNLTSSDVLGSSVFTVYQGTGDRSVGLVVPIVGGQWYGLAFGTGLLGADPGTIAGTAFGTANASSTFFGPSSDSTQFIRMRLTAEAIPEPGTALLIGLGLAGVAVARRRRSTR
jgi:hypothetical protein